MTLPIRLSKRITELLSCSRREAELIITGGWVSINGQIVEEPQFLVSHQTIELHPDAAPNLIEPVTILFHLPINAGNVIASIDTLINAGSRSPTDASIIKPLKRHLINLTATIPLEHTACGLLVLTQDKRVSQKLLDSLDTIEQEYLVDVTGTLPENGIKLLNHGLKYNEKHLAPIKVSWQSETRLRFALKGMTLGQIPHACHMVGLKVSSIKRIRIGGVSMSKLPPGQWRYLPTHERF